MASHGPDRASYDAAIAAPLAPHKIDATMAFMFEGRFPLRPTRTAAEADFAQRDYDECWSGFRKARLPDGEDKA